MNRLSIGRTEVTQVDLGLPFGISEGLWQRKCREALEMAGACGAVCVPDHLRALGKDRGLTFCDPLPALRRLAAEAALRSLRVEAGLGHVQVYARMPSREVLDCVHRLAEVCRYVSVAGGRWTEQATRMLLREYGTAPPGGTAGCRHVTVAFDPCPKGHGEEVILDLTREGMAQGRAVRPHIGAAPGLSGLPRSCFYDAGALLGHLYIHGGLDRQDLRVWCTRQ